MQCLTDNGLGAYVVASPQPTEYTGCTYILAQPQDVAVNAWSLTTQQGTEIAIQIAILFAIGAVYRVIINFLKSKDGDSNA